MSASRMLSAASLMLALCAGAVQTDGLRIDRLGPFSRDSDGAGELSSTPYSVAVRTDGALRVKYHAPRAHCSPIRITFQLDGRPAPASAPIEPGQDGETVDFGRQDPGVHQLGVNAEGIPGGCNGGRLLSWGGMLSLWTSGLDAGPVGTPANRSNAIFAIEKIGYRRGANYVFDYIDAQGAVHRSVSNGRRQPASDDGYYGADWMAAALGDGQMVGQVAASQLTTFQSSARVLAARLKEDTPVRRPLDRGPTTTNLVYAWDVSRGAYRRLVLSEHGQKIWSSPPPPDWEDGSVEAAAMNAWLSHYDDGVRDR